MVDYRLKYFGVFKVSVYFSDMDRLIGCLLEEVVFGVVELEIIDQCTL